MARKLLSIFGLALVLLLPVAASAYTINDVVSGPPYTDAELWSSGQAVGGGYAGSGTFQDAIGNQFATDSITITFNPFTIVILTNNQPGGWNLAGKNWGVADFALNATPATASYDAYTLGHFLGAVSPFELGIDMQAYAAGTPGQGGNGIATLANVYVWATSFSNANPIAGLTYGGAYKSNFAAPGLEVAPVEVRMLQYDPVQNVPPGIISWVVNDPALDINNALPDYQITITFPGLPGVPGGVLWGTALCGNDIVVPVPGTLLLMGSGLLGLVGLRRFRKS